MQFKPISQQHILKNSKGNIQDPDFFSLTGLYSKTIFGSDKKCLCGLFIPEGNVCEVCGVLGINEETAINNFAHIELPVPYVSEFSYKKIKKEFEKNQIKLPKGRDKLILDGKLELVITNLSRSHFSHLSDYVVQRVLVVNPIFREPSFIDGEYMFPNISENYSTLIKVISSIPKDYEFDPVNLTKFYAIIDELFKDIDFVSSGKTFGIRSILRSNEFDTSFSSVIVPDPNLSLSEIGIPHSILEKVLLDDLKFGIGLSESLLDYQAVMVRFPILHKYNVSGFNIKLLESSDTCLRIHPMTVGPFAGDFDGDVLQVFLIKRSLSGMMMNSKTLQYKNEKELFSLPPDYKNYRDISNDLEEDFDRITTLLTREQLPPFNLLTTQFSQDLKIPKLDQAIASLVERNIDNSSIHDKLGIRGYLNRANFNRKILQTKQISVAVSGYNTRQLALLSFSQDPKRVGEMLESSMSFTEGMTQKSLSLKHGSSSSGLKETIPIECHHDFRGSAIKTHLGILNITSNQCHYDGKQIISLKENPIFSSVFPIMKLLGFNLGSSERSYVKYWGALNLVKNYPIKGEVIEGPTEFYISDFPEGFPYKFGICDLSYYSQFFDETLMKKIFDFEVLRHSGIQFNVQILNHLFDMLKNYEFSVLKARNSFTNPALLMYDSNQYRNLIKIVEKDLSFQECFLVKYLGLGGLL